MMNRIPRTIIFLLLLSSIAFGTTGSHVIIDSGSTTVVTGDVTVVQPTGSNLHVSVDSAPTTTITGSVTANAGTNLNTSALNLESTQSGFKSANHTDLLGINTTLGSPFQAGGSIANTAFGISGTLPAFASTPTFNLGTLNGAATNSELVTINSTLGTPFQAAGSIGNTAFIANAGTNLNTSALNLEATQSGFKSANHTDLGAINTTLGTPFQAGGSVGNTTFGATQATAANLNATVVGPSGVALAKDSSLSTINTTLGSPFQAGGSIGNTSFIGTLSDTTQSSSRTTDGNVDFECANLNAMRFFVTVTTGQQCGFYAKAASAGVFQPALFFDEQQLVSNGQIDGSGFSTSGFYDVSCAGYKTVEFQCTGATALHPITFDFRANPSASENVNIMGGYITEVAAIDSIALPANAAQETGGNLASIATHEASIDTKVATATLQTSGNSSLSTIATNTGTIATNTTGVSTSALQTTANTKLDTIATDVVATQVAQASTTSGQNGNLVQMATITAHPTHVTAKTNALSGDVNGNLRVTLADSTMPTTPVTGTFFQATQPVSGTFFQATQPVSIATAPALVASSAIIGKVGIDQTTPGTTNLVALGANQTVNIAQINGVTPLMGNGVTGTGSQRVTIASDNTAFAVNSTLSAETTKVIGTVNVAAAQTIGVTQATAASLNATVVQATGSNLHVAVDSAPSTAVTNAGTFAAQVTVAAGATTIGKAEDAASANADVGVPAMALQQTTPADTAGTDGDYTFLQMKNGRLWSTSNIDQFGGTNISTGTGAGGAGIPRVTVSNDSNILITPPTLTKGTQGSTGFSVQELKDAGRTNVNFYASGAASGTTTTETAITLTKSSGTAATTTGTSFTCTNGKTYRITSMTFGTRGNATGTAEITTFSFRINTGGAVTTTTTPITLQSRSGAAATALAYDRIEVDLGGDGYEIACNGTLQFGLTANSVFTTNAPTWDVLITGYEY